MVPKTLVHHKSRSRDVAPLLDPFPRYDASKFLLYGHTKRSAYQNIPEILPDVMVDIKQEIRMIPFGICARISEKASHETDWYQSRKWVTVELCALPIVLYAQEHVAASQTNFH